MVDKLPHYSRERLLGEGGMGKVYLAKDNQLQRYVAIKELTYQLEDEKVNHALEEARLLARVNHTNIIQIYDLYDSLDADETSAHQVSPYEKDTNKKNHHLSLVMEYFKSKTLTQFQNETFSTLIQKLDLLGQLASGLAAAHKNDVIHCDLKPSNILVNDQGHLKITDFGIACLAPKPQLITQSASQGSSQGTDQDNTQYENSEHSKSSDQKNYGCLFYMSPEQINKISIDYRSDIFSFGIIAYQLMVGSHPFSYADDKGSASQVADNICKASPEHAKNVMINAPTALTDLLMEMLVKPVEQRTLTAVAIENRFKNIRTALMQAVMNDEETVDLSLPSNQPNTDNGHSDESTYDSTYKSNNEHEQLSLKEKEDSNNQNHTHTHNKDNDNDHKQSQVKFNTKRFKGINGKLLLLMASVFSLIIFSMFFYTESPQKSKQVVILKPTLVNSPSMAAMQKDLVISAVEDALRQTVINTKNMYLVSQREVNAISKEYPDDLKKLRQAVGASDIITTLLECDNSRCKVSFSRLVVNPSDNTMLSVKYEKNWLAPIDKFNAIYSTSQTQFASLFPKHPEVNQSGLGQRPINEKDYRSYIELYSQIKGQGNYSDESLTELEALLTRSPYLYAAYGLYRDTALDLYLDSQDNKYFNRLDALLKSSPPEYRYSSYEAIDRFWLASDMVKMDIAKHQVIEAQKRGADELIILELEAYMFFNTGQYEKAAVSYDNAFKLRPSSTLLYNIAFSYWRMGDLEKSKSVVEQVLGIFPANYHGLLLQANIFLLKGQIDLAITAYENIVKKERNSADLSNLGLAYSLNKQYKKSLEYAKLAVNKSPEHSTWLSNLADIKMILGDLESANILYNKVISTLGNTKKYRYWLDLAQAHVQLNENDLALEALNKAKELAPDNGEVAYTAALVYSVLGEKNSAIFEVKKSLLNKVGAVWFNLPWFDALCSESKFKKLMKKYDNAARCININ